MSMREYEVKGIDNTQRTTIRLDLLIGDEIRSFELPRFGFKLDFRYVRDGIVGSNVSVVSDKFPPIARHIQVIYFGGKIIFLKIFINGA